MSLRELSAPFPLDTLNMCRSRPGQRWEGFNCVTVAETRAATYNNSAPVKASKTIKRAEASSVSTVPLLLLILLHIFKSTKDHIVKQFKQHSHQPGSDTTNNCTRVFPLIFCTHSLFSQIGGSLQDSERQIFDQISKYQYHNILSDFKRSIFQYSILPATTTAEADDEVVTRVKGYIGNLI